MAEYAFSTTQTVAAHKLLGIIPTLITLEAGKHFIIGTQDPQEILINETVPEGKQWKITFCVDVVEEDV